MNHPQFFRAAADILAAASDSSQMLQEDAGNHPELSTLVTYDENALETVRDRQDVLYERQAGLADTVRLFTGEKIQEPQAGAELDNSKRIG